MQLVRTLALAVHFLIGIAALLFTIAAFNSGSRELLLWVAFCGVFWAPLLPMVSRAWRRRSASVTSASYITRTGWTLGVTFAALGLGSFVFAAGFGGLGESRLAAAMAAIVALWLSSLTFELSRRKG